MEEVIMPKLGLTMDEGTIVRWVKKEGDPITKGEILFEVDTDKAVNEVESFFTGTLGKVLVEEGETATVLQVIAYILEPGESAPESWPEPTVPSTVPEEPEVAETSAPIIRVTPIARRLAKDKGIDLTQVKGTREQGTITKEDVLHFADRLPEQEDVAKEIVVASPRAKRIAREKGVPLESILGSGPGGRITEQDVVQFFERKELITPTRTQSIAAERLTKSFTSVPHFYLRIEVDASSLSSWRERLLPVVENAVGVRLTYTDMLVQLVAKTLEKHPRLNASWEGGFIRLIQEVNLGIATSTDEGLVVPVVKNANRKELAQIAEERKKLTEKAQSGKLGLSDLEGGTFTITNLGMFGIDEFEAIINPPQSAILSVGRIAERVVAKAGHVVIRPTLRLTLSIDHRVLDGAVAARFLEELKGFIEAPDELLATNLIKY